MHGYIKLIFTFLHPGSFTLFIHCWFLRGNCFCFLSDQKLLSLQFCVCASMPHRRYDIQKESLIQIYEYLSNLLLYSVSSVLVTQNNIVSPSFIYDRKTCKHQRLSDLFDIVNLKSWKHSCFIYHFLYLEI